MQEAVDVALAEINTSEPYVIRISRREFMELSLETRYKITQRQVMDFCALKDVDHDYYSISKGSSGSDPG